MHRCAFILIGTLVGAACAQVSADPAEDARAALQAADSSFQVALVERELEGVLRFYLEDAVMMPAAEPMVVGMAAIRAEWEHILGIPGLANEGVRLEAEVSADGTLGYTMGTYLARMEGEDGALVLEPGKWVTVWKRQADGSWRIAVDIYNTDVPPPDHK